MPLERKCLTGFSYPGEGEQGCRIRHPSDWRGPIYRGAKVRSVFSTVTCIANTHARGPVDPDQGIAPGMMDPWDIEGLDCRDCRGWLRGPESFLLGSGIDWWW